jgi:hypothetical protein
MDDVGSRHRVLLSAIGSLLGFLGTIVLAFLGNALHFDARWVAGISSGVGMCLAGAAWVVWDKYKQPVEDAKERTPVFALSLASISFFLNLFLLALAISPFGGH